jgi:hypothetical protein
MEPQRGRAGKARQSYTSLPQEVAARILVGWPFIRLDHRFTFALFFLHRFLLFGRWLSSAIDDRAKIEGIGNSPVRLQVNSTTG